MSRVPVLSVGKRPSIPPGLSALEAESEEPGVVRGARLEAPTSVEAAITGARFVTLRWKPPLHLPPTAEISSYSVFYREEGSNRSVESCSRQSMENKHRVGILVYWPFTGAPIQVNQTN